MNQSNATMAGRMTTEDPRVAELERRVAGLEQTMQEFTEQQIEFADRMNALFQRILSGIR